MKNYTEPQSQTYALKRLLITCVAAALVLVTQSFFIVKPISTTNDPTWQCDSVPPLNKKIVEYVESKLDLKVGEGECWDLAADALNTVEAKWDHEYKFGREIDPKKECIFQGDIIQYDKVKIDYQIKNTFYHERFPEHTSIVYEVIDQESFMVAEQNTSRLGQKVGVSPLKLKNIKAGKLKFYRPVK